MAPYGKKFVVRSWSDPNRTAGGGYIEDNNGTVWRVLEPWESCCSTQSTTVQQCGKLMSDGEIKS